MSRVETIGNATLYLGDCRDILPTLPKVDAVITDPPYAERTHVNARTIKTNRDRVRLVTFDSLDDAEFVGHVDAMLNAARRWVVLTCDHAHGALLFKKPEFVRLGAWVKHAPMPQITADRPGSGHESIAILHPPGKKRWNGGSKAGIWTHTVLKDPAACFVPTQKPLPLLLDLVTDFTDKGEVVLDPFMGSGTTGVACMNLGRHFVGVEMDAGRFDIACRRIEDAQRQGRLIA
jgi:DNA modification methylase